MLHRVEQKIEELSVKYFPYTNVIGLARSIVALGLLLTLLLNSVDLLVYKTTDSTAIRPMLQGLMTQYNFFTLLGIKYIWLMKGIAVLVLSTVISGFFPKITSVLHWWIAISFLYFSSNIDGGDQIGAILTLFLIPVMLTDSRKNHWHKIQAKRGAKNIIAISVLWFIRLQVAVIYFQSSVGKFFVREWADGTAIYYWWNNSVFGMPIWIAPFINYLLSNSFVVSGITYGVLIFELLLFLGLTASIKYRKIMLVVGIFFHFLIIIFHGIFSFFFSITAALILFLYPTYQTMEFLICPLKILKMKTQPQTKAKN